MRHISPMWALLALALADIIPLEEWIPSAVSMDKDLPLCEIPAKSGRFVGVCRDVQSVQNELSFCKDAVCYNACVPPSQPLWPDWNLKSKDKLVGEIFNRTVEARIVREMTISTEEYVTVRLTHNLACIEAYKNALCWYNFPKCGCMQQSLALCRSACENYHKMCGYTKNYTMLGSAANQKNFTGLFPECDDLVVSYQGLFSSYAGKNMSEPGNVLVESEHTLADETEPSCKRERFVGSYRRSLAEENLSETIETQGGGNGTIPMEGEEVFAPGPEGEQKEADVIINFDSPLVLVVIGAIWEALGIIILTLLVFYPYYYDQWKVNLWLTFGALSFLGFVLVGIQINSLRTPPPRATVSGPAYVVCPTKDETEYEVPETCATVFTMDQLQTMSCYDCTGHALDVGPTYFLLVLALLCI